MSEEIKKRFNELIEKGRELSGEEIGIISALMEHEHLLVQQYEKEKLQLIAKFLKDIKVECKNCLRSFGEPKCVNSKCENLKIYQKWEEKLNEFEEKMEVSKIHE